MSALQIPCKWYFQVPISYPYYDLQQILNGLCSNYVQVNCLKLVRI